MTPEYKQVEDMEWDEFEKDLGHFLQEIGVTNAIYDKEGNAEYYGKLKDGRSIIIIVEVRS